MEGMPRWDPDARPRLVAAALQLFYERGYDGTTVTEIAERAGLTKSTFFRYFPDKRDVLAAGQEALSRLLVEGIAAAPPGATPLAAVDEGLQRAATIMTSFNREIGPMMQAAIAASAELRERSTLKQASLAAAMTGALRERGVDDSVAALAAELGGLAFREAYAEWISADDDQSFGTLVHAALERLRVSATQLR